MARITMRQMLDHAAEHGYGVPAFNINNMEQANAILAAAAETDAPVILQASRGARAYSKKLQIPSLRPCAPRSFDINASATRSPIGIGSI